MKIYCVFLGFSCKNTINKQDTLTLATYPATNLC